MFEKEAEEYTKKNFCGCCSLTWKSQCKNFVNCGYHDSWKDGAEFGYNKANEWHYVKDGKYPKEDCLVYYKDAMGNFSCSYVHPSHYIAGIESFFKANPQIIAWKEIVLPKESE